MDPKNNGNKPRKTGYGMEAARDNSTHHSFPSDFIQKVFVMWYESGKPSAEELWPVIREQSPLMRPSMRELQKWIVDDFVLKALQLDDQIEHQMDKTLIEHKLDMLNRQAQLGKKMQDAAWEYLEKNELGSVKNAISLLKLGLETEREAMSVPGFLKGIIGKSEADLLDELKKMVTGDPDIIDMLPTGNDDE